MMRRFRLGLLALTLAAACGNENGGQNPGQAGDLTLSYYQGGPEAGAILLTISGGPVENVTAVGGQQVSFATPFAGTTKVVVTGSLLTGDLLRIRVPDVSLFTHYTVRVDQVADKVTFSLIDTSQFSFTVHK